MKRAPTTQLEFNFDSSDIISSLNDVEFEIVHIAYNFPIAKTNKNKFVVVGIDDEFTYQPVAMTDIVHDTLKDAMEEARQLYSDNLDFYRGEGEKPSWRR